LAYFLRRLSLDLVGIARATKGDVTPAGEKFCEILQRLAGISSPTTSVKMRTDRFLTTVMRIVEVDQSSCPKLASNCLGIGLPGFTLL
jgi:hypothetical protein